MKRSDIVAVLSDLYPKLVQKEIDQLVKSLFESMANNIADGERIEIRGFGSFSLKERKPGTVRNPRHGVAIASDGRHVVYFRAGKELKERVNASIK